MNYESERMKHYDKKKIVIIMLFISILVVSFSINQIYAKLVPNDPISLSDPLDDQQHELQRGDVDVAEYIQQNNLNLRCIDITNTVIQNDGNNLRITVEVSETFGDPPPKIWNDVYEIWIYPYYFVGTIVYPEGEEYSWDYVRLYIFVDEEPGWSAEFFIDNYFYDGDDPNTRVDYTYSNKVFTFIIPLDLEKREGGLLFGENPEKLQVYVETGYANDVCIYDYLRSERHESYTYTLWKEVEDDAEEPPAIPAFPLEAIFLGLIFAGFALIFLKKKPTPIMK